MKTPKTMEMKKLILVQQDGVRESTSQKSEQVVNYIVESLKKQKTAWRTGLKTESEINGYKQELLIACAENNINTQEQIDRGLAASRKDSSDFFPSVGKFVQWCISDDTHWFYKALEIQEKEEKLALPKPKINKSVGLKYLAEFKKQKRGR